MMYIVLGENSKLFPDPFILIILLKEPDLDVSLDYPLREDKNLVSALNGSGAGTHPCDLQVSGSRIL